MPKTRCWAWPGLQLILQDLLSINVSWDISRSIELESDQEMMNLNISSDVLNDRLYSAAQISSMMHTGQCARLSFCVELFTSQIMSHERASVFVDLVTRTPGPADQLCIDLLNAAFTSSRGKCDDECEMSVRFLKNSYLVVLLLEADLLANITSKAVRAAPSNTFNHREKFHSTI